MSEVEKLKQEMKRLADEFEVVKKKLEEAVKQENQAEWPQFGDKYWMIDDDGLAISKFFNSSTACKRRLLGGNCHRTEMKAIKADKWKMSSRTQARRMVEMCEGFDVNGRWCLFYNKTLWRVQMIKDESTEGGMRFVSSCIAQSAIDKLGEPLIKVALGVIDGEEAEKIVREAMMREWK